MIRKYGLVSTFLTVNLVVFTGCRPQLARESTLSQSLSKTTVLTEVNATHFCSGYSYNGVDGKGKCINDSTSTEDATLAVNVLAGVTLYDKNGLKVEGSMVDRGATWDLTTAFPGTGKYSGVTSGISLSKVCSTQNVLGSAGTAACISGTTSSAASAGDIIAGNEAWSSSGTKITGTMTNRGTLDASVTFPGAGYYGATPTNVPSPSAVCTGTTLFGSAGTSVCNSVYGDLTASNQHRNKATTQVTLTNEAVTNGASVYTNADPGYRAIPNISKDDEGYGSYGTASGEVTFVSRTNWTTGCDSTTGASGGSANATCKCGLSGTIAARIADCAAHGRIGANATWDGATKGNAGQGVWKLVTRTGNAVSNKGREVWQDQRTKLLWSSLVATSLNWCKASGSNNITNNPAKEDDPTDYCDNATYQTTGATGAAVSACFEDDGTYFTQTDGSIDVGGKGGLGRSSTPVVGWRLPTIYDYEQANVNGIRFVMYEMPLGGGTEWSATIYANSRGNAYWFTGSQGVINSTGRTTNYNVRCVGRGL